MARRNIYGGMDPLHFNYTPDYNDPELLLRRRQGQEDIQRQHLGDVNEVSRAGLLGSSAGFDVLGEGDRRGMRYLDDINNQVYGRQRSNSFDLYQGELNFRRQKEIERQRQEAEDRASLLGSLGDIGGFVGGFLPGAGFLKHLAGGGMNYHSGYTMGEPGFQYPMGGK